ncbi:formate dehydrogenase subunit gamma [Pseudorhodoplanes sp.]|uniref:formate dehydrogenase subunit gamma n=1 Tax=Pseudorhodoplanes sp. TaxID=1934341 RepID=UPI00391C96B2
MSTLSNTLRIVTGALALLFIVVIANPAAAQQRNPDGSVNPTASAVREQQLLQELQKVQGRVTIPNANAGVLIQPAGQNWRQFHEVTLRWIGGIAIVGMLILLVAFYLIRGMIRISSGRSGRTITRFNAFERFVHWMTATCFIILAITGLNITFGRPLLMPLMSAEAFTTWSEFAKYAHNFVSFPFTIGVVLIFLMWITGNIPNRVDVEWIKRGGGIVGDDHPPAYRFNAGQKMIYWIVVIGGAAVAITGYILMFPFYGDITVSGMQTAQVVHSVVSMLFIAAMLAHIYIGSIGMEGAFEAMGTGEVDVNWAREHHSLWLDEEMRNRDAAPTGARATPAE